MLIGLVVVSAPDPFLSRAQKGLRAETRLACANNLGEEWRMLWNCCGRSDMEAGDSSPPAQLCTFAADNSLNYS